MVLGEIEAAVSLLERLEKLFRRRKAIEPTVAARFVQLFEGHGIHRNQLPRFLGGTLTLADMHDDAQLLARLDDTLVEHAASLLGARREWLDCADNQIYATHDFYKRPEAFNGWIEQLCKASDMSTGVLIVANTNKHEINALLVFEEHIGQIAEKPVFRYHLCNNWIYSYWKSRAYLTACIAGAWRRKIYVMGRITDIETVRRYRDGGQFLDYSNESALPLHGKPWYPEDMALRPDAFLDDLDEGAFGRRSGLELWLRLEESGFMDSGLPGAAVARSAFVEELQKCGGPG
jgi:hypothetical protein